MMEVGKLVQLCAKGEEGNRKQKANWVDDICSRSEDGNSGLASAGASVITPRESVREESTHSTSPWFDEYSDDLHIKKCQTVRTRIRRICSMRVRGRRTIPRKVRKTGGHNFGHSYRQSIHFTGDKAKAEEEI